MRFVLMPGHRFDPVGVASLIDGSPLRASSPTRPSTAIPIIADLNERGAKIAISQHPRRASPLPIDAEIYKSRHLIESFFCKLKEFKRTAMRAETTSPQISISPQP